MQGRVLAGRYRLESQLGQGGMGSVWRAEHLALHAAVAVKLMDPAIAETPEGAERFRREAQAAASLRSTHVVQVLDYGVEEGTPYLVMELLHGESLASCLDREHCLSPARTLAVMTQVSRAIARAHGANIVHRDLKPDNIFLIKEDDQEVVKVLDFGIAKTDAPAFGDMKTRTGMVMGTPHYMSPEQTEGKRTVDFRTDLWAMAVIICECLTGIQPFRGETWGELVLNVCARPIPVPSTLGAVPVGFDAWFAKATNREPLHRFSSAQELISAFRDVVEGPNFDRSGDRRPGSAPDMPIGDAPTMELRAVSLNTGRAVVSAITGSSREAASSDANHLPMKRSSVPLFVGAGAIGVAIVVGVFVLRGQGGSVPAAMPTVVTVVGAPGRAVTESNLVVVATSPTATLDVPATPQNPSLPSANVKSESKRVAAKSSGPIAANREPTALPEGASTKPVAVPSAGKSLRCYTDPFTGMVRLDGSGARPAQIQTFACKQNPFTGQYQKL